MEDKEIRRQYRQENHLARIDSMRHDHLNLEMIDSVSSLQSVEKDDTSENPKNKTSRTFPKQSHWAYIKQNIPIVLTQKDIQTTTDPDNLTLSELDVVIEQERRFKKFIKLKEPWSIWLSRVADWVCVGSTFIIIFIHLFFLIFYLFKDREA